jgi:hypothetical protein
VRNRPSSSFLAHGRGGAEEASGLLRTFDGRGEHGKVGEGGGYVFPDSGVPPQLEAFAEGGCRVAVIAALDANQT